MTIQTNDSDFHPTHIRPVPASELPDLKPGEIPKGWNRPITAEELAALRAKAQ